MIKILTSRTMATAMIPLGIALATFSASAEDIDIYSANTSVSPTAPNVLIVLDNTANWNTPFTYEKAALAQVVGALNTQFNLGLMLFTETGSPNNNTDGGYVRFAIQSMTNSSGAATNARNCLLTIVGATPATPCSGSGTTYYTNLDILGDKSNGGKAGTTMGEVYDYFKGANAYAGSHKVKADPLAFVGGATDGSAPYKSPVAASTCQQNFVIVISNGPFQDNSSDTSTAMSQLGSAGGDQTIINPPDTSNNNNAGDEWTRYLNKADGINAVTYTLEVLPSTTGQGPYNTQLLQSMGRQGKGGYYSAIDAATLLAALTRIFNDINAKNSVFASASLPLSADNSGAYANQVYLGVFRPDAHGQPRWLGNVKQYKFAADTNGNLSLVDSANLPAAGASGFAQPDAISFWTSKDTSKAPDAPTTATPAGTGGFWYFDAKGSGGPYDWQDGEWVEKGGAAQQLRLAYLGYSGIKGINDATAPRKVYTCTGTCLTTTGTALSATPFDTSNLAVTDTALGTASAAVTSITSASSINNSSIVAGTAITISQITNPSGKTILVTTSTAHGYATGDTVTIQGTSSYDGIWSSVTVTGSTTFTFTKSSGSTPNLNPAPAGSNAYGNSTSATVTTATAHGFSVGEKITVSGASPSGFNTVATVVSSADTTHFTYTLPAALGGAATTVGKSTSNKATATAAAHGLSTGQSVTIAGAAPSGYNGVFVVTVIDVNTFTYYYSVAAPLASASGTITGSVGGGRTTLINWIRGLDTQDENGDGRTTDVRASIHGDVLHTRPVVLNYGVNGSTDNVYVFYGGNDGVFRAIKGGQLATDGTEQWAFIAQEFFGKFKRLYDNSPSVLYPSTPAGIVPTPIRRDYMFDGPVGSYIERDSTGAISKAYLYIAGRRGGRFIYALDVTFPTNPKILWKKSCPNVNNNTGCDPGFSALGQTWSSPVVVKIDNAATAGDMDPNHTGHPVIIMGGGYDIAEDAESPIPSSDTMGTAIFVLDATTGAPIFVAGNNLGSVPSGTRVLTVSGMNFGIASDVLAIDRNQDGFYERGYTGDLGGNVWRIDFGSRSVSSWNVWKIASVADRTAVASSRKFMFAPDVVFGDTFDSIVIGSGDREHPLSSNPANNVQNRVYMFKDPNLGAGGADLNLTNSGNATPLATDVFNATSNSSVPTDAVGWYINLAAGEKVVNGPLVPPGGSLIFGTNQPCASGKVDPNTGFCDTTGASTALSCSNTGIARRYSINYLTGAGQGYTNKQGQTVRSEVAAGGGFLPSPVAGKVEINGVPYMFVTDNPLNPGGVIPTHVTVPQKRFRVYWREVLE